MYIDIDKATKRGIIGKVKARLNGMIVDKVVAAKHGKNGFVEYHKTPVEVKGDEMVTIKKRGNVKLSFNL